MRETALEATYEGMTPKQQKAADAMQRRTRSATLAALKEKMPHLGDNALNATEHIGGALVGWGGEVAVRLIVEKLAQPAPDGSVGFVNKYKNYVKGGTSIAVGAIGMAANLSMTGSAEGSTLRRVALQASTTQLIMGVDRLVTPLLKLPS